MKKLIPLLYLVIAAGCSTIDFQIGFPSDVDRSSFTRYEVAEIPFVSAPISRAEFGPYSVNLVRYGLDKKRTIDNGFSTDTVKAAVSEKYTYELRGLGKSIWSGECESSAEYYSKEKGIFFSTVVDGYYRNIFKCRFSSTGQTPIELQIEVNETYTDQSQPGFKKGYLRSGSIQLNIERTTATGNVSAVPMHIGYYIYHKGELVAVVQNQVHGNVYISSTLDRKLLPLVVNAAAAILTYYDLESEVLDDGDDEN
ncbi:MAG TPA: hypothetical protein PK986_00660 [Spirochaetota bacterium]|nr:hypothetical protein [Spirochaetota bacterium]